MNANKTKAITKFLLFFNVLCVVVVLRQATVVHGDGAGGFGEVIIKGFMASLSLVIYLSVCISAWMFFRRPFHDRLPTVTILLSCILIFFGYVSVYDACYDKEGYCREWRITGG
ncbi:MAG: hypothetical protein VXW65_09550 [Pseudomonadota bacterium]|nr:hypothetical protein [Pseudomonadota bacterium]